MHTVIIETQDQCITTVYAHSQTEGKQSANGQVCVDCCSEILYKLYKTESRRFQTAYVQSDEGQTHTGENGWCPDSSFTPRSV